MARLVDCLSRICETAHDHEVARDQSRLDQLEGLLLSSTQQNREFRELMMSSLGVEPMLVYSEYIFLCLSKILRRGISLAMIRGGFVTMHRKADL